MATNKFEEKDCPFKVEAVFRSAQNFSLLKSGCKCTGPECMAWIFTHVPDMRNCLRLQK